MNPVVEERLYSRRSGDAIALTREWRSRSPCPVSGSVELEEPVRLKPAGDHWCTLRTLRVILRETRVGAYESWEVLPAALSHIGKTIEDSRQILEYKCCEPDDVPIEEATWRRAAEFLTRHAKRVWETTGGDIESPDVLSGPDGSVDLHWDRPTYELLINIPADQDAAAGFYADDRGQMFIKGRFDPSRINKGLIDWLRSVR